MSDLPTNSAGKRREAAMTAYPNRFAGKTAVVRRRASAVMSRCG